MSVTITTYKGRFDICHPSKEEWQLCVKTPFGNVSEFFDEEPNAGCVDDALCAIEARQKDFWVKSNRDEQISKVKAIRDHLDECEALFYEGEIAALEARRERIDKDIASKKETLAWLREEMGSAQ